MVGTDKGTTWCARLTGREFPVAMHNEKVRTALPHRLNLIFICIIVDNCD